MRCRTSRGQPKGKSRRRDNYDEFADGRDSEDRWYRGRIKYFDENKGYGFIQSPEIFDMYNCDVFIHQSQLNGSVMTASDRGFELRDDVEFQMRFNNKQQPQATDLRPYDPSFYPNLLENGFEHNGNHKDCTDGHPIIHTGVIKHIDKEKGFGFVYNQELFNIYQTDVYVAQQELHDLGVRDQVNFVVKVSKQGQPQATNLQPVRSIDNVVDTDFDVLETPMPSFVKQAEEGEDTNETRMTGTVKSFDMERGYGFISSPEAHELYDRDVFLHSKQIKNFTLGDHVTFSVKINSQGHPQAYGLQEAVKSAVWLLAGLSEESPSAKKDKEVYEGDIKSFSSSKGYGFIDCAELYSQFRRDVFIHQSQFDGLNVGDRVSFHVQVKRGQPQACNVTLITSAPQPPSPTNAPGKCLNSGIQFGELDAGELNRKLHRACASARAESIDLMRELLEAGADPNSQDVTGSLPLMISALNDRNAERKCRLLIENRADPNVQYNASNNVLQWARERINAKFASYLKGLDQGEVVVYSSAMESPPEEY